MLKNRPGTGASTNPEPARTASVPRGCTNLKLRQLTRAVSRHYDAVVGATGLKGTQYSLLSQLVLHGPMKPSALAAHLKVDPSTLTRNLQPLVARGWVALGPGADARSRLVAATEAGHAKRIEGQRAWKQAQLALNEKLGPDRVVQLHALLDECQALFEADPDDAEGDA
ncbi:MarR family winged helix-turn-helix transcriptional regulator [Eleftheria terrae]|uniref:MarR family winged helix-turn-helix transcriptional regulator n=1 Tax=Eleftheria terrae TaxID=1597781 RepID=UPI00263BE503|nr:MarR family winged helix-turn-helix transcriptional regulator [Eleftheria terrae]WKB52441.1 MarR family winged helix-turn-helix transcriptional regulator [Eleftheria terrae]